MKDHEEFLSQWQSFKLHLIELRKKLLNFKDHISTNKLKLKNTATEWVLRQVLGQFQDDFGHIVAIAKIALVAPVSNAWPERGASAIMRIKTRSRSQMKNDLLEALTMILMNGPDPNTTLANELIKKVTVRFDSSRRNKRPTAANVFSSKSSSSVSVQTDDILTPMDDQDVQELIHIDEKISSLEQYLHSSVKNVESWIVDDLQSELSSEEEPSEEGSQTEEEF